MIRWSKINLISDYQNNSHWKVHLKIGLLLIFIGYFIFILKEVIVGLISLICFIIGGYFISRAFTNWKNKY